RFSRDWSSDVCSSDLAITYSSPAVANGVVYIGSGDGEFYAFSATGATNCSGTPKTCKPLWTGATGPYTDSSPAVANGVVYVGSRSEERRVGKERSMQA